MGFADRALTTIVVTHNSAAVLSDCLESLNRCAVGPVIVVDNASNDRSADLAEAAGAEVHKRPRNEGFARAANFGARAARSPFLCFLNPDCTVEAGLFSLAADALREHPRCIALPCFLHDDGEIIRGCQPGYTRKKLLADIIENNRGWSRLVRLLKRLPTYDARSWQWPLCACAFIEKEFFFEAGGFDERYFLYMEDVELGLSISRIGGTIAALDATVRHHAQTGSSVSPDRRLMLLNTARLQYARRHYGPGFEHLLRTLMPVHGRMVVEEAG